MWRATNMITVTIGDTHYRQIDGIAALIIEMACRHRARINTVTEGKAEWLIWPTGNVEFNLCEMVDDTGREAEAEHA